MNCTNDLLAIPGQFSSELQSGKSSNVDRDIEILLPFPKSLDGRFRRASISFSE
jgi:hypothetical protein